jgi:DNA-binding NarL/FixJ family response regulator
VDTRADGVAGPCARAVVADELPLVRAGVAAVLRELGYDVVAEAYAVREVTTTASLEPLELVVLGAVVDADTAAAARRVMQLRPPPVVVALVPPGDESAVGYLVALGVHAVAPRSGVADDLAAAVEAAAKGERYVAPALHDSLTGALRPRAGGDDGGLTGREREVLTYLAEGRSNREIAAAMSVTLATVKSHLAHLYAKLGAGNRREAIARAVVLGILAAR